MFQFEKYEGLGNDFIIPVGDLPPSLQPTSLSAPLPNALAARWAAVCDRRLAIGGDGILLKTYDANGAVGMHIVNQDGSQAEMCGNGLRCMALHLARLSKWRQRHFEIHTLAGAMKTAVTDASVRCHIGRAEVGPQMEIKLEGISIRGFFVSTGNPHFIIFDDAHEADRNHLAPLIESHRSFSSGVNVSFAQVVCQGVVTLNVYERGCGWTQACGTAATATAAALWCKDGHTTGETEVRLPGGNLTIGGNTNDMIMEGGASFVFDGRCFRE